MDVGQEAHDWYDGWIEDAEDMKVRIIADTHFNHDEKGGVMRTKCLRPEDFTNHTLHNWRTRCSPQDLVIHIGDVIIGPKRNIKAILSDLPGRKILVRGNHDRDKSCLWWMENGFDFACDHFVFRNILFTHEPANAIIRANGYKPYEEIVYPSDLPYGCEINIHGHLHNIWDGFMDEARFARDEKLMGFDWKTKLKYPWQRLLALEYTDYSPVELSEFLDHPAKYQSTGPRIKV